MTQLLSHIQFNASTFMYVILALGMLIFWRAVSAGHKSSKSKINIEDLLLGDDGKMSRVALFSMGSFFLTSWMLMYMTLNGTVTEAYYNGYLLAWVAPIITRIATTGIKTAATGSTATSLDAAVATPAEPPASAEPCGTCGKT